MLIGGQRDFARALLAPGSRGPGGLLTWNGSDPAQRFAVYRNNVAVSLIEALTAAYPVVRQLVGDVFFREMARTYVGLHPPRSRIMLGYGERFPEFIATFAPAAGLPYLADVARLEGARRRAYHAADAVALEPAAYADLDPDALGGMIVMLHPSVTILRSPFAIVSLWAAHQGLLAIESVDPDQPEDVLVVRPAFEVEVVPLSPGVAGFLASLAGGATVMDALARALDEMPEFDIAGALATLMSSRTAVTFKPSGE